MKQFFMTVIFIFSCPFLFFPPVSDGAVYYVRPDGGTATQCTGTADAPYPGSGTGLACAWSHPFWALNVSGQWKIQGGDTLTVNPGNYRMGYGAPNTDWCSSESAYDCMLPPIPSGPDSGHPTVLMGAGCNGSYANAPSFWGTQRPWHIIDLTGSSNVRVECLEITDHSGCVEGHADPAVCCERDNYPYGDWAAIGLAAADSSHVTLWHLNIHGLAGGGVRAGRLSNWTVEDVRIAGNGWSGWDGDIDELDSNSGDLIFRKWLVEWNGCGETYPGLAPYACWGQSAGGYGDGVGTGLTGGHWIIEDSIFRYNTSDGLDLLYARESGSHIDIRRTQAYGNAGNQIKTNGPTKIENTVVVGNCGFFEGKSFTYNVDNCRAAGNSFSLSARRGSTVSVVNSTIAGQGDCLAIFQCDDDTCDGTEHLIMENDIFLGSPEFGAADDQSCCLWMDRDGFYQIDLDYNVFFNGKPGSYEQGAHDLLQDPLVVDAALDTFDGHLTSQSPAIDNGLAVGSLSGFIPADDLNGHIRPVGKGVDRGAYEYAAAATRRFWGAWPDGIWIWNRSANLWSRMADTAAAQMIVAGDVDGDGLDDLTGVWASGLWVRYAADGQWIKLTSNQPTWLTSGDLNHDGRDDVIGTWKSDGVYYRDSVSGNWIKLTTPARQIAVGKIAGTRDDLIGVWDSGLWVRSSATAAWQKIDPSIPVWIAAGDMTGDGRADIVGSYISGTWIRDSATAAWQKIATSASQVTVGDINGDGRDDLIGIWPDGVWVRYALTHQWQRITSSKPIWMTTGRTQ
jgi:hypothetical protein